MTVARKIGEGNIMINTDTPAGRMKRLQLLNRYK
jgi:hypothetical protein